LHISIKLPHGTTQAGDNLINFAHISRDVSCIFGPYDPKLSVMNPVGSLTTEAIVIGAPLR
jgi:hypothetical protein